MRTGFGERKEAVMAVFRVEKVGILVRVLLESKRSIWKMKPRFSNEDQRGIIILKDL